MVHYLIDTRLDYLQIIQQSFSRNTDALRITAAHGWPQIHVNSRQADADEKRGQPLDRQRKTESEQLQISHIAVKEGGIPGQECVAWALMVTVQVRVCV